ncbi:MAG: hypothetical protein KatS3mg076_1379 [Candidatus Binatia bacterium]|nr:MAG: hypothetical protein KatS3mg076_1379 [Candidatus Binatia bacterium]
MVIVAAQLNAVLIFGLIATFATAWRPESSQPGLRWIVPLFGAALLGLVFRLEAELRRTSSPPLGDFAAFLVGSSLAMSPALVALGLGFFGLPALDVYLASAFSGVLVLSWAFRYRVLFLGPAPSELSRAYSVTLVLVGLWHVLPVVLRLAAGRIGTGTGVESLVSRYVSFLHGALALSCFLVAWLRYRRSPYSLPATGALSVWLALDLPVGTATFLYWLLRGRRLEGQIGLGDGRCGDAYNRRASP